MLASLVQIDWLGERERTLGMQVCSCINQLALLHIYQESRMSERISTKNGSLHLSNDKNLREGLMEAKVDGE